RPDNRSAPSAVRVHPPLHRIDKRGEVLYRRRAGARFQQQSRIGLAQSRLAGVLSADGRHAAVAEVFGIADNRNPLRWRWRGLWRRALRDQGAAAVKAHDFAAALELFERAYSLRSSANMLPNIGVPLDRLDRADRAVAGVEEFLATASRPPAVARDFA